MTVLSVTQKFSSRCVGMSIVPDLLSINRYFLLNFLELAFYLRNIEPP